MTSLDTVLGTLTGPRSLRSALRRETVAIKRVLNVLAGPIELCVRIPASVFGGDIFGVMSTQLREALIVPPQSQVSPAKQERRGLSIASANPAFPDFKNPFPLTVEQPPLPTPSVTSAPQLTSRALLGPTEISTEQRLVSQFSLLETQISRKRIEASLFGETSLMSVRSSVNSSTSSMTKAMPRTSTLVSSLNRYWQSSSERRDTSRSHPQPLTESPVHAASLPVTDSEQRTAPLAWPNFVARDVSEKLRSFTNATNPLQKSAHLSSAPERQIQNVFNIEVNHANQHASNFDDLGDRIAQLLHEQALQHGIDVT